MGKGRSREKNREYQRAWYKENVEKARARGREAERRYRERHPDEIAERIQKQRARNRATGQAALARAKQDGSLVRQCRNCGESKPVTDFWVNVERKDGLQTRCVTCMTAAKRAHYAGHPPPHRRVVERLLGRRLLRYENVHHINGDETDNRIENLYVCTASQHGVAHASLLRIVKPLMEQDIVLFDREAGEYRLAVSG